MIYPYPTRAFGIVRLPGEGGSKVPAAWKTTKTGEIAKKIFISLKAYIIGTRTQKLKSLAQKMKK